MKTAEKVVHNYYWIMIRVLGILSAYFFLGTLMPAKRFYQEISINSGGGDIQMTFIKDINEEGIITFFNCAEGMYVREKRMTQVLPFIYKEIEVLKPIK